MEPGSNIVHQAIREVLASNRSGERGCWALRIRCGIPNSVIKLRTSHCDGEKGGEEGKREGKEEGKREGRKRERKKEVKETKGEGRRRGG